MSQTKTKNAAEDLMASLMEELNLSDDNQTDDLESELTLQGLVFDSNDIHEVDDLSASFVLPTENSELNISDLVNTSLNENPIKKIQSDDGDFLFSQSNNTSDVVAVSHEILSDASGPTVAEHERPVSPTDATIATVATVAVTSPYIKEYSSSGDNDKTVAIAAYSNRNNQNKDNNIKVSVGQSRGAFSSGYATWGSSDSQLAQAENLRIAQEKILEIEKENEKIRLQNEELIAASEIVRERADLLTAQVQEFKNDRDGHEQSFKSEMQLIRHQYHRKDNELQKAQMKIDELDSRLKFDMKKIRIRERELENRLELIRAEKNALVKSKDEQILDLRRKMDQVQLEVESYRQKCVDLNKVLDTNQDSFKRTTRALRLAMANLELQDENKIQFKKVD